MTLCLSTLEQFLTMPWLLHAAATVIRAMTAGVMPLLQMTSLSTTMDSFML